MIIQIDGSIRSLKSINQLNIRIESPTSSHLRYERLLLMRRLTEAAAQRAELAHDALEEGRRAAVEPLPAERRLVATRCNERKQ